MATSKSLLMWHTFFVLETCRNPTHDLKEQCTLAYHIREVCQNKFQLDANLKTICQRDHNTILRIRRIQFASQFVIIRYIWTTQTNWIPFHNSYKHQLYSSLSFIWTWNNNLTHLPKYSMHASLDRLALIQVMACRLSLFNWTLRTLETNFSVIRIKTQNLSFTKILSTCRL